MNNRLRQAAARASAAAIVMALLIPAGRPSAAEPRSLEPARYHGTAADYGAPAPAGTPLTAEVGGVVVAGTTIESEEDGSGYQLVVPADDPSTAERDGAREGELLVLRLGGVMADQVEYWNAGEDRRIDVTTTRIEVCLSAFEDRDRDGRRDAGEAWLPGVTISVRQFFVVRTYTTTGADEPSCALETPDDTEVEAVDWPRGFDPVGSGAAKVRIIERRGTFDVRFPFVDLDSLQQTATDEATATATGTATEPPTSTPTETATDPGPTATATDGPSPTATDTETPTSTPTDTPTASPSPTASATPASRSTIVVDSPADPGVVGDDRLTLREAIRLATGDLLAAALSADELDQVGGSPGAASADTITFDDIVFPGDTTTTITIQPPSGSLTPPGSVGAERFEARPGLPPLSTGGDTIDGTGHGVLLTAGPATGVFDGLVVTSNGNALRGLALEGFSVAVFLRGQATGNTVGGRDRGAGVSLTDNIAGLVMSGPDVSGNLVLGSRIGLDATGNAAAGNATHGVLIEDGAHDNAVGAPYVGNVISGNQLDGVAVKGPASNRNVIVGNLVGTSADGARAVPNGIGIDIGDGAVDNVVGGPEAGVDNVVSGNSGEGIWIHGTGTRGNVVQSNLIGIARNRVDALGNGGSGVLVSDGARSNMIGGDAVDVANRIFHNGGAGVRVRGPETVGNSIRQNPISANAGLGIDLEDGGNRNLAAPIITAQTYSTVRGIAPPNTLVEIHSDPDGEGRDVEGTTRADGNGFFLFNALLPMTGPYLFATATDAEGNTSEFGGLGVAPPTPSPGPSPTPTSTARPAGPIYLPYVSRRHALLVTVSLYPKDNRVVMGSEVVLELTAEGLASFRGLDARIAFDPAVVEVIDADPAVPGVQIAPGEFPDRTRQFVQENAVDSASGRIAYTVMLLGDPAAAGSGVVARIRLRGRLPGTTRLQFEELAVSDDDAMEVRAAPRGARVDVVPPPSATSPGTSAPPPSTTPVPSATSEHTSTPSATPSVSPTPSITRTPSITPTASVTPTPSRTPVPSATFTASATFTVSPTTAASPTASATTPPTQPPPPTATRPPTQPPPATPTPPDACARPLVDGGFESDGAWTRRGTPLPSYVPEPRHGGQRSILLGIRPPEPNQYSRSTIWQPVAVPSFARTMAVGAWTFQAAEPGGGADRQLLLVYDVDPGDNLSRQRSPVAYVFGERTDAGAWQRRTATIDVSAWRGRTLWIYASVVNDGLGGRVWMALDDVEVAFCP